MTERELTERETSAPTDAIDAAASAPATDVERAGMAILDQLDATSTNQLVGKLIELTERHAAKMNQYGDCVGDAVSLSLELLARSLGTQGLPSDLDQRAILVAGTAKKAAVAARDKARRAWSPRDKGQERVTAERDAVADAAPNSLGRWTDAALIARAERYTSGDLSPRTRTVYAVTSTGQCEATRITTRSRVLAGSVIDARDASHLLPRRTFVKSTSRHAGGTSPAAESTYWRLRSAMATDVALESALALVGIDMSALTDVGTWHKSGSIAWQALADKVGQDRGTVRYRTRQAARAARSAAKVTASPRPAQTALIAP